MANLPGGGRSTTWILIILVLFLSVATMANLYLLLDNRDGGDEGGETAEEAPPPPPPTFVAIDPMTVNLQSDIYGNRLLYVGLTLRVGDQRTSEIIASHMPEIHSRLLVLLSSQKAEDMTAPGGKQMLAQEIKALLAEPLEENLPPLSIVDVLFTNFIVQ